LVKTKTNLAGNESQNHVKKKKSDGAWGGKGVLPWKKKRSINGGRDFAKWNKIKNWTNYRKFPQRILFAFSEKGSNVT